MDEWGKLSNKHKKRKNKELYKTLFAYAILLVLLVLIGEAQAESRFKIAVLDTGVKPMKELQPYMCSSGHRGIAANTTYDSHGHGTNIAGLIARNLDPAKHCIVVVKIFDYASGTKVGDTPQVVEGILHAINLRVDMINLSMNSGTDPFDKEYYAMMLALSSGIRIVLSAGNESTNLDKEKLYPVSYDYNKYRDKVYIVGSNSGNYSNTGSVVKYKINGTKRGYKKLSGTSQSAAIFSGLLAKILRK
jgi:subtilisin family serine protease